MINSKSENDEKYKNRDMVLETNILKRLNGIELQLHSFTMLEDAPDTPLWNLVRRLYRSKITSTKIMGMVLNYALTTGQSVFTLSMSIVAAMIREDANLDLQKPSDATLRKFFVKAKSSLLKELFPFQEASDGNRARAGLYLINDKDIRVHLEDDVLDKEEGIIELYAKSNKIEPDDVYTEEMESSEE